MPAIRAGRTRSRARGRLFEAALFLAAALALAFLVLPVAAIFLRIPPGDLVAQLGNQAAREALVVSLKTNLLAEAIILLVGTPAAYLIATKRFPLRSLAITLVELPLVVPPAVAGLVLLAALGLPYLPSRVVNHVGQIEPAAAELAYPIIVKPNIGGSGALMRRFETPAELRTAVSAGEVDAILGLDHTAIVQEYHSPRGGSIVRVEALDDRFLYAIRIHNDPSQGFNICPADICQTPADEAPAPDDFALCPADAPARSSRKIEVADPPTWVVEAVLRIFRAANVDVGGVEYLESERDGQLYLYDVNALSNFVTDAPSLVGFDPFERFVDYLERRAGLLNQALAEVAS